MISGSNSQRWWWHLCYKLLLEIQRILILRQHLNRHSCWKMFFFFFKAFIFKLHGDLRQSTCQDNNLQHTHRKNRDKKNTQNYLSIHMFKRSQGKGLLFFCFLLLRSGKIFLLTASLLIIFLFPNHFSSCFPNVGINNAHD